jgi:hypothetical protein
LVDFGVGLVECTGVLFGVAFGVALVGPGSAQFVAVDEPAADVVGVAVALALALEDPVAPDDPALGLAGELVATPLLVPGLALVGLDVAVRLLAGIVWLGEVAGVADEAGELADPGHEGPAEGCLLTVVAA